MRRAFLTLFVLLMGGNAVAYSLTTAVSSQKTTLRPQKVALEKAAGEQKSAASAETSSQTVSEGEALALEEKPSEKKPLLDLTAVNRDDLIAFLGIQPPKAFEVFGLPTALEVLRGESAALDDVVSVHNDGVFLFWFDNHLWQMGFAAGFNGGFEGIKIGTREDEVIRKLGKPSIREEKLLVYEVFFQDFPVSIRFVLKENRVSEIYFYRSDL